MANLICTRCDENISEQSAISHPILKAYAERIGADFKTLSHSTDCNCGDGKWHYRIMKIGELLSEYDRIAHIDTDILITPNCPNIFEEVPSDCIGTIYEDKGSRASDRFHTIRTAQDSFGRIGWNSGYINTGVFVVSKIHADIFQKICGRYWCGFGYDDVHLGYNINMQKHKVHELHWKWNHMTMFSEPWNGCPNRFDSHMIHYAGGGVFDKSKYPNRLAQMKADFETLYG